MSQDLKSIISDYYTALQSSYDTGILNPEKLHLSENPLFKLPNEIFHGTEDVLRVLRFSIPIFSRFEIHRQYYDDDSCCSILTHYTKFPTIPVPNTQWIHVKNGKIIEINMLYESTAWNRFLMLRQH